LGWATITHPFHPLRNQRFEVLKTRCVAGTETLILRHRDRGSYTVVSEWTDWGLPGASSGSSESSRTFAVAALLQLADLCAELSEHAQEDLDE
jgi:hypothetical protein